MALLAEQEMAWFDALPAEHRALYRELDEHVPASTFLSELRRARGDLAQAKASLLRRIAAFRAMLKAG